MYEHHQSPDVSVPVLKFAVLFVADRRLLTTRSIEEEHKAREQEARAADEAEYKQMLAEQCLTSLQVEQQQELSFLQTHELDLGQGVTTVGNDLAAMQALLTAKPLLPEEESRYALAVQELQFKRQMMLQLLQQQMQLITQLSRTIEAALPGSTGACGYNRPCAHQYVGKYQSCMVENGLLIPHASYISREFGRKLAQH